MMQHWAEGYLGTPWVAGAQGPDAYDCWAFFRQVQACHYGRTVPFVLAPDYDDPRALADLIQTHQERTRWVPVPIPADGDAVLIHKPMHIGVWLNTDGGGVLHCVRGAGVVFTGAASWRLSGFGRREYYRYIMAQASLPAIQV